MIAGRSRTKGERQIDRLAAHLVAVLNLRARRERLAVVCEVQRLVEILDAVMAVGANKLKQSGVRNCGLRERGGAQAQVAILACADADTVLRKNLGVLIFARRDMNY
jgi:hypothetical protein